MPVSEGSEAPIIIIKKKAGHGGGHHGGAWKVAYADFVTAMMALFIVLWLLSSSEKVKKAVGSYFQDPTGSGKLMGSTMGGVGESLTLTKDDMKQLKQKLEQAMKTIPKFDQMKNNIELTITSEGLRVELIETEKGMFFESGNAHPSDRGQELLARLATEIGRLPNTVLIEGHTDAKPYPGEASYTNWELSADRANSARHIMQENGMRPNQVAQVRGFADQRLRMPNDPTNPANRRVSVIIQYLTNRGRTETAPAAKPVSAPNNTAKAAPPAAQPAKAATNGK
ncbi:MAG TPA: flagellar motor protein MotB [Bryobacteraceae bacterium]|nr:flagellar motor protein MotB [Bryobacteraceae bacterium]